MFIENKMPKMAEARIKAGSPLIEIHQSCGGSNARKNAIFAFIKHSSPQTNWAKAQTKSEKK